MTNQSNVNVQPLFGTGGALAGDKAKPDGEWMSIQEASNATGLSMGTLRRYVNSGKIKHRRLGRTKQSKLEVLVTQDFLPDQAAQGEYFGAEDADEDEEFQVIDQPDQSDQPMQTTLAWMREKLDEKDALLKEKDSKIETLARELAGATYRNGYLESEKNNYEQKILLLEDKSRMFVVDSDHIEATEVTSKKEVVAEKPEGTWTKVSKWLTGK